MRKGFDKQKYKENLLHLAKILFRKNLSELDRQELFQVVAYAAKDDIIDEWMKTHEAYEVRDAKVLYYMSMEFLMGRALGNLLLNISEYHGVSEALGELGFDLNLVEDREPDPALGNGGLGRLAACFLDSLATLGYGAYGCGIRYRYGMFAQKIENGYQVEVPDQWLRDGNPFEIRRPDYSCEVKFGGTVTAEKQEDGSYKYGLTDYQSVIAVPYDMPVVGYGSGVCNTLRVWDAIPVDRFNLDSFDKGDYMKAVEQENLAKTIVEVLYPNDNHMAGKELRLRQQYFFISASVQTAVRKYKETHGGSLDGFEEKVIFQMNDTHPSMTVPELLRILLDEEGYSWDRAWYVVHRCTAYTNHTIMSEALEKWPVELLQRLLPRIYSIIEELNRRFLLEIQIKFPNDFERISRMEIIHEGTVRMAYLAIYGGSSVNGVAALHTEILKKRELRDFYEMWPERFYNMTNGVTQRRFLLHANPLLSAFITKRISDRWITDFSVIRELRNFQSPDDLREFMEIKAQNKIRLAEYIREHNGIEIDPSSFFDVQVKRLHEYKRQLLNILDVICLYQKMISDPAFYESFYPQTFIFGAKAAAGYETAKLTIKLINNVAKVLEEDSRTNRKLRVVFIEDYKVSNAEIIISGADLSEQISTASKEASGTSNMKFMMNGAVTIGTMDGANVEIISEVGRENAFLFGLSSEEVMAFEKNGNYDPKQIFEADGELRDVLFSLVNGTFSPENTELFRPIYESLLREDRYFILKDFRAYHEARLSANAAYRDREKWSRMAYCQVYSSGKFSSDRTVREYIDNIWHLDRIV